MKLDELENLAREFLDTVGLTDWTFKFNNNVSRLGVCKYRSQRIEIQKHYAARNPEEMVLDTLLHEIAHALVGPGHKHGPVWQRMAEKLGCTPKACSKTQVEAKKGDWQGQCPGCKKIHNKYRQPKNLSSWRCKCGTKQLFTFYFVGKGEAPPPRQDSGRRWGAACPCCGRAYIAKRKLKNFNSRYCPPCGPKKGALTFKLYEYS